MAILLGCFPINEGKAQFLHKRYTLNTTNGINNLKHCIFLKFQCELLFCNISCCTRLCLTVTGYATAVIRSVYARIV